MVICPKCNQPSVNEKICGNCWADLKFKPKKADSGRDLTKMPLKNVALLALMFLAFGIFLIYMGQTLAQMGKPPGDNPVSISK